MTVGWLRTLMDEASPAVGSYGQLARMALAHPDWPADTRPQPRSLAALLSKLDRDQELDWLADRPAASHVLAEVLRTSPAALERSLRHAVEAEDAATGRLRLDDVPFARVLELGTDPLPPGIPDIVLQPPRWQRLLWRAPSGSGRSLVGRWLATRGLAAYVQADAATDVRGQVAQSGPVFVEVQTEGAVAALLAAAPRAPICIAGPFGMAPLPPGPMGFCVTSSPPPADFADALVRWLAPRLSEDAEFDEDTTADVLRRFIEAGACRTLGDLLGIAGLVDELGPREVERHPPAELARRYVSRRLRALRDAGRDAAAWHADGYAVLEAMSRSSLTDSATPWGQPMPADEWARLVPSELQRTVDPEWLRMTMAPHATSATLKELERALQRLPPGGFQVVKTLQAAGLLRAVAQDGSLAIRPQWLSTRVASAATRSIAESSPFEWGEALLEPASAAAVQRRVSERVARDAEAVIEDLLELGGGASPAHAAATECLARVVGLALLRGELEPPESLDALWDAAVSLTVDVAGVPEPRVGMPDAGEGTLTTGAYHLAMLAISEVLPERSGRRHAQLRPWLMPQPRAKLIGVLDAIARCLGHDDVRARLAGPAGALIARLAPTLVGDAGAAPHVLELPLRVVESLAPGPPRWADIVSVLEDPRATATLAGVIQQAGTGWSELAWGIFEAWQAAGYSSTELLARAASEAGPVWDHAPPGLVARAVRDGGVSAASLPWGDLSPGAWETLVGELGRDAPAEAYAAPHVAHVARALARTLPRTSAAAAAWRHHPSASLEAARAHLRDAPESVAGFVEAAGWRDAPAIVAALSAELTGAPRPEAFVPFLHRVVQTRAPGWRDAYDVLVSIERPRERGRSLAP